MIKLLKKLLELIKSLFKKKESKPEPKQEQPKEEPKPEEKPEKPENHHEGKGEEPENSEFKKAKIDSFLWKPVSDGDGNVVILISCDNMISSDVKLEIKNRKGNAIKVSIRNTGRANGEAGQKFARIHYRIGRQATGFKKASPLTAVFYHTQKRKKEVIRKFRIKDPTKRLYKK